MYAIGIDIGGTNLKVGVVNEQGLIIKQFAMAIDNSRPYSETIQKLGKAINDFLSENNFNKKDINGVGVGCPGVINSPKGVVDYSCNLHWDNVPLKSLLEAEISIPVRITNDANAAALGEAKFGAGSIYKNMIMLTLGTGVGGGVVLDGKLFEGNEGKGTELGHIVVELNGRPCGCGRRGCLEAYASATGLIKTTREFMILNEDSIMWEMAKGSLDNVDGKLAFDAEKLGDKSAALVVKTYVSHLAEGIMNFCNIFRPEAIVLSGGVAKQGDNLTKRLVAYCEEYYYGYKNTPKVEILTAKLGYDSGIIGSAALFLNK